MSLYVTSLQRLAVSLPTSHPSTEVVCASLQLIGPGFPPMALPVVGFDGSGFSNADLSSYKSTESVAARVGRLSLVRWNVEGHSGRGVDSVLVSARGTSEHKYEALTPNPGIHTCYAEQASRERPTWGTRGARAAIRRVTWTSYPRAAPVVSGGKAKHLSNVSDCQYAFLSLVASTVASH